MLGCLGFGSEPFLFLQVGIFTVNVLTLPQLLQDKLCGNMFNTSICQSLAVKYIVEENEVQKAASLWLTVIPASQQMLVMVTILFVGPLSDILGKRRVMLICPVLSLVQSSLFLLFSVVPGKFNPAWLFIPMLVSGISGDSQGALLLSLAYKADTTARRERTNGISCTEGFAYFSVATLSLFSGLLLQQWGFVAVFGLNILMSLASLTYVAFVLPNEVIPIEERNPFIPQTLQQEEHFKGSDPTSPDGSIKSLRANANVLLHFDHIRKVFTFKTNGNGITIYLIILFLCDGPTIGLIYVGVLFLKHSPFSMTKDILGYTVALGFACQIAGVWLAIPLLQRFLAFKDFHLLLVGFVSTVIFFVICGLATATWMLYGSMIFLVFGIIPLPVTRSLITKHVPDDLHGTALALAEFCDALASLTFSFAGNFIYSRTVSISTGIVMFVFASLGLLGVLCTCVVMRRQNRNTFD